MNSRLWQNYYSVTSIEDALDILAERREAARIVAGATDLILEIERGVRKGITALVDISRVPGLDYILMDEDEVIHLGPLVTHNHCVASKLLVERGFPLVQAAWEVGAPQIRNRGTVAGNLITASPANDTITPLIAMTAKVVLRSRAGQRTVPLEKFYMGVRRTVMQPDEMLVEINFPALPVTARGTFVKIGLRRAQAISVVDAALTIDFAGQRVRKAAITLGAVAPTIVHAPEAEAYLAGLQLEASVIEQAARLAQRAVSPIDDVRGSADYRLEMVRVSVLRGLRLLAEGSERQNFPAVPVLLEEPGLRLHPPVLHHAVTHLAESPSAAAPAIETTINGKPYTFTSGHGKTLLRLLREDAGLVGTKEGCAEGECGACTIFLDGQAVMSCLVPAPRAHGAEILTIEGLAGKYTSSKGELHPVQQAFIETGAVQCGYCTPGFLMSAAMLLAEQPLPTRDQIEQSITGNLCRCTGYYKIVEAIERASQHAVKPAGR